MKNPLFFEGRALESFDQASALSEQAHQILGVALEKKAVAGINIAVVE